MHASFSGLPSILAAVSLAASFLVAAAPCGAAQEWATKMFSETSHNFGTVARGSKTEHRFVFRNLYKEDLHVSNVRSSCGCTSPEVTKRDLKTHETAEIVAKFNTRTFLGQHGATVTVTFDKPFYAEVQLRVAGNIRSDVTFDPPFVDLGNVDLGKGVERTVRVTHVGGSAWQINDVRSANSMFEVVLSKPLRTSTQTAYDLTLRLKPDSPAGYVKGQLILVTDDPRATQIPMDVEGRVVAEVTASPQFLSFGEVAAGGSATKNLVVRANRPFKVTGIACDDPGFSCELKPNVAAVQILPITFRPVGNAGRVELPLRVLTDLGEGAVPTVTVQASVADGTATAASPPAGSDAKPLTAGGVITPASKGGTSAKASLPTLAE